VSGSTLARLGLTPGIGRYHYVDGSSAAAAATAAVPTKDPLLTAASYQQRTTYL
jgi:hypothetical protein